MLERRDFFCQNYGWNKEFSNPTGRGFANQFEKQQGGKVIFDRASGLTWQQSGSENYMVYWDVQEYIKKLNREQFAGYSDWRLPTLEEAMSLMEPKTNSAGLYIDLVFDQTQRWIWTADKESASRDWIVVDFLSGLCGHSVLFDDVYVRAVR